MIATALPAQTGTGANSDPPWRRWRLTFDLGHTGAVKAVPIIAVIFSIAVVLERGNAATDGQFWAIVAVGIVGVVAAMSALRSRGGIGATG